MYMKPYEVYIQTNENGYITAVNSSAFLTDTDGWIKIDEGYGDKYHHAQGNYFSEPIMTFGSVYRYKFDGAVRECTAEEIAEQEEANKPKPVMPKASHNINAGEYVTVNGVLYKATSNIPNGEPIIVGQNAVVTTIEEQLYELMKGA